MKARTAKTLAITCAVCLFPILLGLSVWDRLPETMAIHFSIDNVPNNFAPKAFVVFGLPALMAVLQLICICGTKAEEKKYPMPEKMRTVTDWIIPVISVVLQIATLGYGLGEAVDVRKIAMGIVGIVFLLLGNHMPKLNYVKNVRLSEEKARKVNRFLGYETVVMGVLCLISLLFPPTVSAICLLLLIPYILLAVIYTALISRQN